MKKQIKLMAAFLLPLLANAQTSFFNDGEATTGAIRNLAHNASTETEAAIYNPAGLAFSSGKFAISVNGTAYYQQVQCRPFEIDENGDHVFGWEQDVALRSLTPSVQSYVHFGKGTISFSYANESGVSWYDPMGDIGMSYLLENDSQLTRVATTLQNSMRDNGLLANEGDYLKWSTFDYDSKLINHCIRFGGSYDLEQGFSAYIGVRYNHIRMTSISSNDLFVFVPSRKQKVGYTDYLTTVMKAKGLGHLSDETEQALHTIDSLLHNGISVSYDYPTINLHTVSPVVGFAYHRDCLDVGLRYEMSPSVYMNTSSMFFPHLLSGGVSVSPFKWLTISASGDLKWGCKGNDALKVIAKDENGNDIKPMICQLGLGFDFGVTERFCPSISVACGNAYCSDSFMGRTTEFILPLWWNWRVSCGAQCKVSDKFLLDFAVMMNFMKVKENKDAHINEIFHQRFEYQYGDRFTAGIGLTYVLN